MYIITAFECKSKHLADFRIKILALMPSLLVLVKIVQKKFLKCYI